MMIERFGRFSFAIFEITRHWHKLASDEMAKYGLKGPHATYLTTLYSFKDGITAPKLCELCGKDKADVSRMMSIMEEKGRTWTTPGTAAISRQRGAIYMPAAQLFLKSFVSLRMMR